MMKDVTEIKNYEEYDITIGIAYLNENGEPEFQKSTMTVHTDWVGRGMDLQSVAEIFGVEEDDVDAETIDPDEYELTMFGIKGFVSQTKDTDYNPAHDAEQPLFVYRNCRGIDRRIFGPVIFIRSEFRDLDNAGYLDLNDGSRCKYDLDDEIWIKMFLELGYDLVDISDKLHERDPEVVQCYINTRKKFEGVKV